MLSMAIATGVGVFVFHTLLAVFLAGQLVGKAAKA